MQLGIATSQTSKPHQKIKHMQFGSGHVRLYLERHLSFKHSHDSTIIRMCVIAIWSRHNLLHSRQVIHLIAHSNLRPSLHSKEVKFFAAYAYFLHQKTTLWSIDLNERSMSLCPLISFFPSSDNPSSEKWEQSKTSNVTQLSKRLQAFHQLHDMLLARRTPEVFCEKPGKPTSPQHVCALPHSE